MNLKSKLFCSLFLARLVRQSQLYNGLINLFAPSSVITSQSKDEGPPEQKQFDADILLVEDNKVNQVVGKTFLKKMGCRVMIANNGKEALKALVQSCYDLVLMDCQMPVMDGFEATEQIRQQNINCRQGRASFDRRPCRRRA